MDVAADHQPRPHLGDRLPQRDRSHRNAPGCEAAQTPRRPVHDQNINSPWGRRVALGQERPLRSIARTGTPIPAQATGPRGCPRSAGRWPRRGCPTGRSTAVPGRPRACLARRSGPGCQRCPRPSWRAGCRARAGTHLAATRWASGEWSSIGQTSPAMIAIALGEVSGRNPWRSEIRRETDRTC